MGAFAVAQGESTTDDRGTRKSTLLFPVGSGASIEFADGSTQPISTLHVRMTEYTSGKEGPDAMPAILPEGIGYTYCVEMSVDEAESAGAATVTFDKLHLNYLTDAQRREQTSIAPEERTEDFREVTAGLDAKEALYEASRCYSCGNCFECDGCYGACPENAIMKLGKGKGYAVRYDLCTGCRACFLQCPCHAIEMVPAGTGQAALKEARS